MQTLALLHRAPEEALLVDHVQLSQRRRARHRPTPERRGVLAELERGIIPAMQALMGRPLPRPFARVTTSGRTPRALEGEPRSGPSDPGLDLLEDQQRVVPVAQRPASAR